jgi:hypothetical protein
MNTRLSLYAAALLLAACTGANSPDATADDASSWAADSPEGIAVQAIVAATGADPQAVKIISVTEADFSDSSLGCPEPGMAYMQVITRGYRVVAEYDGLQYDVRGSGKRGIVCNNRNDAGTSKQR